VFPGQIPKLGRQGEGDKIVPGRKPLAQLVFYPLLVFMVLAVGTVSVTAGKRDVGDLTAVFSRALGHHAGAMFIPAVLHGVKGLFMG